MTIYWSKPLLEKLLPSDLWEKLHDEVQVDPSFDAESAAEYVIPFYNAKTGRHLKDQPAPYAIRASRWKMRKFCAQGIDVQYKKTLSSVEYSDDGSVKAYF
jgi:hypothetical protein